VFVKKKFNKLFLIASLVWKLDVKTPGLLKGISTPIPTLGLRSFG
jgi:hypothetical protein